MAPSRAGNNVIGAIGGVVLAACLAPQLVRLYRTQSARDLSYGYLALYISGLTLTFVYLYFEGATVAWICALVELAFVISLAAAKYYLDHWGPFSERGAAAKAVALGQQLPEGDGSEASGVQGNGGGSRYGEAERGGVPGSRPGGRSSTVQQKGKAAVAASSVPPGEGVRQRGQHA